MKEEEVKRGTAKPETDSRTLDDNKVQRLLSGLNIYDRGTAVHYSMYKVQPVYSGT